MTLVVLTTAPAPASSTGGCGGLRVPGADHQESSRTTDLTTAGVRPTPPTGPV